MSQFKVGDIVEAWGCQGKVIKMDWAGVQVEFDNCLEKVFMEDGRYMYWHKEPILKLVERPKAKVKKILYQPAFKTSLGYELAGYLQTKEECENIESCIGLGPAVEIEVDSE